MSTRVKFLLLLFLSFGGMYLALTLFMSTDYAKEERAYFKSYPYLEMAAREKINPPDRTEILTASLTAKEISEKIIKVLSYIQPETSEASDTRQIKILAQVIPPKTQALQSHGRQQENRTIPHPSPALAKKMKKPKAREHLKKPPEENWRHVAKRGYDAYDEEDYEAAILHFERALKISPNNRDIHLQLAYAYKRAGQNSPATKNFKSAIDLYNGDTAPFPLRREVEQMARRLQVNGYVIYRDEPSDTRQLGADLTQSQAGVELSYQPENTGFDNGRKFQIFARFLSGMKQDRLELNPDSYQAGIGLRIKPLSSHNLVLSAERLLKVGTFARDDWMIRAGYSYGFGTDYREDMTGWWSYNLYLDAALIDPGDPDIFLTSQVTGGYSMAITQGLVLQPRLTGLVSWQKDSFRQASLFEAGPGLNLRYHFNDTKYEAYRSYIDLTVEYRVKISGNSTGGSGPVISLLVHF